MYNVRSMFAAFDQHIFELVESLIQYRPPTKPPRHTSERGVALLEHAMLMFKNSPHYM